MRERKNSPRIENIVLILESKCWADPTVAKEKRMENRKNKRVSMKRFKSCRACQENFKMR